MPMTDLGFFLEFREVADRFNWELTHSGMLRARAKPKWWWKLWVPLEWTFAFCPITAVHYSKTRRYIRPGNVDKAGRELGMSDLTMAFLMSAADKSGGYPGPVRDRMLQLTGLKDGN